MNSIQCQQLSIAVLVWMITITSTIKGQAVPAIPADSFVESIGVNTHWAFPNVYTYNYTGLKAKLGESGIRYVRDGTFQPVFVRANDLYNSLGIKTNMLAGRFKSGPWPQPIDPTQIDAELNDIKIQALAATVSLEAPNEYDLSHGPDTDWVGTIKTYSTLLYNKAKADPLLRNLPVIGPSLTSLEAYQTVGDSDPFIDYGNQHLYQWTFWPGFSGFDTNGTRSITWYLDELARVQSPSRKMVQGTEAGYTDYVETGGLSEEADGKYMARIFAEFFRRGIYRTYKYELVNQGIPGREGLFGLLRNDLSEKPSFRAVKNLITILSDKGPNFTPDTLNYVLNGSMDNIRQILFQKRNGDFYLMVWLEVSSWSVDTKVDLYPPPQQVVLTLHDTSRISGATLYAFTNNADVNTVNLTIDSNQVTFNATDKISIIKLTKTTNSISHGIYRFIPKRALDSCIVSMEKSKYPSIFQSKYHGDFSQQWIVEPTSDSYYRLINRATGRILTADGCKGNNEDCQKWKFESHQDNYYRLTPKHDHAQCLCGQQWYWLKSDCQHWKLQWISPTI